MTSKRERALAVYEAWSGRMACPICMQPLAVQPDGLHCAAQHHFDISSKGTVQLTQAMGKRSLYDKALFEGRGAMLARGLFDPVAQAVAAGVKAADASFWLDAGCGEAVLTEKISQIAGGLPMGMDIAREAIHEAGNRLGGQFGLVVGDVRHPPLQDGALDAIVNLFTPADYEAFSRALRPGGLLIKAVPGSEHLAELRQGAAERGEIMQRIEAGFRAHCTGVQLQRLHYQFAIGEEDYEALSVMSPVSAHHRDEVLAQLRDRAFQAVRVDVLLLCGHRM